MTTYIISVINYIKRAKIMAHLLLITCFMSISFALPQSTYGSINTGTTSDKIISITKTIILKSAELGLNEAGSRLLGSAWPYFKTALDPLFQELKKRFPSFSTIESGATTSNSNLQKRIVNEISKDPALESLILDGFANLKKGQREIINQLGDIQKVLAQQNEKIADLQVSTNQKLDQMLQLLKHAQKQSPQINYTSGLTMYDIEGTWTLVREDPPGCHFKEGDLGMVISPTDALHANGQYDLIMLPMGPADQRKCMVINSPNVGDEGFALLGTLLKIRLSKEWSMAREVERENCVLKLSWLDETEGIRRYWYFWKDGCKE
ncbi:MAG: hypothetical protein P8173_12810 [Gammaproteobacteria bacterium]|jgi:hypothetical protein